MLCSKEAHGFVTVKLTRHDAARLIKLSTTFPNLTHAQILRLGLLRLAEHHHHSTRTIWPKDKDSGQRPRANTCANSSETSAAIAGQQTNSNSIAS